MRIDERKGLVVEEGGKTNDVPRVDDSLTAYFSSEGEQRCLHVRQWHWLARFRDRSKVDCLFSFPRFTSDCQYTNLSKNRSSTNLVKNKSTNVSRNQSKITSIRPRIYSKIEPKFEESVHKPTPRKSEDESIQNSKYQSTNLSKNQSTNLPKNQNTNLLKN